MTRGLHHAGRRAPVAEPELSAEQIAIIRASYVALAALPQNYVVHFYHRLLERHPFTRAMFPDDLTDQINIFRVTVDALVEGLHDFAATRVALADLGRRHVGYGVRPHHYIHVGDILFGTLQELGGDRFDAPTRAAWQALYDKVAHVMIAAAATPSGGPGPVPADR